MAQERDFPERPVSSSAESTRKEPAESVPAGTEIHRMVATGEPVVAGEQAAPPVAWDGAEDRVGDDETPAQSLRDYLPAFSLRRSGRGASSGTPRYREWALLALILALGAMFRFTGVNWDGGHHLHPDERFLTMVESAIRAGYATRAGQDGPIQYQPASLLSSYFDTQRSALNPHNVGYGFFVYGTFPLFLVRWLADVFNAAGYDKVHLLGRVLSSISDLITVGLVYLIGRRLYDPRAGLLGASLVAVSVMHIQQAHFFVFDSFLVTLIAASFYFCVDIAETGRWRSFALAGLFLGLALATKMSMVVFAPIIALAGLIYLWRAGIAAKGLSTETLTDLWSRGLIVKIVGGGALALFVAAVMFRVFQPYAFAGPGFFDIRLNPRWLENIAYQAKTQDGSVDLPPSIQWAGTEPILFPWRHMVAWGMGIPLGLTAWAGFLAAAAVVAFRGRWQHLLLVAWTALCFLYFASVLNKTMRYLLPMYPFIILLGAWGLVALYDWAKRQRAGAFDSRLLAEADVGAANSEGWRTRLTNMWARSQPVVARWGPRFVLAIGVFVVVSSTLWAYAFTRIYTRPVTRVAASLWIYQNVPKGSVLANEHWDDPLPVPISGYDPSHYRGPQLPMYDADEPKKIETLVQMLSQADYINLTSNRLYGSIPRIPQRYPMSTEYYRRLFAGDLGFKLVHVETSYPTLGPWVINDDRAEEAFTVYDHPKVLIFQKQPDFSAQRVRQILSAVPLDNVQQIRPIQVGQPNLLMSDELRQANVAGGTWSEQFSLKSTANSLAPVLWWLTLQAFGLLAAPILWLALHRLPDRGYGLSKALGLLAVSWIAWLLAGFQLLPWTRLTILLAFLLLAGISGLVLRRHGAAWLAWVRGHRTLILTAESVFLGAFLLVLLFRAFNPDLWHPGRGGEKPMEFSYLNAVIKTTYFPPYDPWFAGGYLNYYYFGYVLIAALTKLTGVMPSIAFNLAVAALYALTAVGCFSFVYNLSRLGGRPRFGFRAALVAGVTGVLLVAFVGNLDGFSQLLERLGRAGQVAVSTAIPGVAGLMSLVTGLPAVLLGGQPIEPFDFWRSSRVIPNNTINEFPFWTFLFADLHAHLIAIPYQVTTLGVLLHLAYSGLPSPSPVGVQASAAIPGGRGEGEDSGATSDQPHSSLLPEREGAQWLTHGPGDEGPARWLWRLIGWRRLGEILFAGWLVGALYVINSWEFPTYLLLTAATFVIAEFTAQRGVTLGGLARAGVSALGVFLLAKVFFRPFWDYYVSFYSSVTPWTADKSRLDHYLIIHGLFIFALVTFAIVLGGRTWRHTGWGRYLTARWRRLSDWDRFGELEQAFALEQRSPAAGYLVLLSTTGGLVLALLVRGLPLVAFLTVLLAVLLAAAWERRDSPALLFASLLASTGVALSIFVEFFALQGDIGRMNTVFKFYLQIWVLWGLVAAAALVWTAERLIAGFAPQPAMAPAATERVPARKLLWESPAATGYGDGDAGDWAVPPQRGEGVRQQDSEGHARTPHPDANAALPWWGWAWAASAVFLLLAALAYPLGATPARLADRFTPLPPTLDGMAYMSQASLRDGGSEVMANNPAGTNIRLPEDYEAIKWILENVEGSPVILEASIPEYRWGSRFAKYTGLPAVLGWRWHQVQQRGTYAPQVDQRLRDVQLMYNDPSPSRVMPLLEKHRVRYIIVGDLERAYYAPAGIAKFEQMGDTLRPVYQQGGVTIYEFLEK
jgi:YYY domain-containing protein